MTTTRHIKSLLSLSAFGLVAFGATAASAQQPQQQGCPPGSWFCADSQVQPAAPAGQPVAPTQLQPLPPQQQQQPPAVVYQPAPAPPPVVVYQPAPPPVVVVRQPEYRGYYYRPYRQVAGPPYRNTEWGVNMRFEGAVFGGGKNGDGGLGGVGAGLRFRPTPYFAIEPGIDFLVGRDYNSFKRQETGLSLSGLLFLNPRSRAQVYLLGGINWSVANVSNDTFDNFNQQCSTSDCTYHYFGGQFGAGIEFRLSRLLALNIDVRGLIRGRTDADAKTNPEFVETGANGQATGRTTNTSGGALITAGMTFYF